MGAASKSRSQGGAGVQLADGGVLSNNHGLIVGGYGVHGSNANGVGGGGGAGVLLQSGGTVVNTGSILGGPGSLNADVANSGGFGVWLMAGGTVQNSGSISGGATGSYRNVGVELSAGGRVVNGGQGDSKALIQGLVGVNAPSGGGATVVNYGTIRHGTSGGLGLRFASASDRLVVEAGSAIVGGAAGGGGTLELASGTGTISGLGGLGAVSGGASLNFSGFGVYDIDKGSSWTLSGTNTLAGQKISVTGMLDDTGTLAGFGVLGGQGTVSVAATGLIEATGTTAADALFLETGAVSNAGLLEGTGKGGLTLDGATVVNTGTIEALAGSRVLLKSATIKGGTLTTTGTGVIETTLGVNVLDGTASSIVNDGAIKLLSGTGLTLEGVIGGTGVITLATSTKAETLTIGSMGATLTGGGEISMGNAAGNKVVGASGAASLTNAGDKIIGAGLLGSGELTLINDKGATILGKGSAGLTIDTGTTVITNGGLIEANAGHVTVKSAIANTGTLLAYAGGTLALYGTITGAGEGKVEGGTLDAQGSFNQAVVFDGKGTLELAHSQAYTGRITGFSLTGGTALDLTDIGYTKGVTTATLVENGIKTAGVLTVTDGTHTAKITLAGNFSNSTFTTSSDGHGGTKVVDPPAGASAAGVARFVAGVSSMGASGASAIHPRADHTPSERGPLLSLPRMAGLF